MDETMDNQQHQNHYVYITTDGSRIYIGKRSCRCPIDEDDYFGSHTDKTYKPTHKEILTVCSSAEQALKVEYNLLMFFSAIKSKLFVNKVAYIPGNCLFDNRKTNSVKMKELHSTGHFKDAYMKIGETHKKQWESGQRQLTQSNKDFYKQTFGSMNEEQKKEVFVRRGSTHKKRKLSKKLSDVNNMLEYRSRCLANNVNLKGGNLRGNQKANMIKGVQRLEKERRALLVELKLMEFETQGIIKEFLLLP